MPEQEQGQAPAKEPTLAPALKQLYRHQHIAPAQELEKTQYRGKHRREDMRQPRSKDRRQHWGYKIRHLGPSTGGRIGASTWTRIGVSNGASTGARTGTFEATVQERGQALVWERGQAQAQEQG